MQSSYGASFGVLKVLSTNFLTKNQLYDLARAKDVAEIAQRLEQTWYGKDIETAQRVLTTLRQRLDGKNEA